ncbi:exopolysaccharide biosynthesis protein [Catenuloplanes atrovinosus]|uniref:Exopolysaccharide biosynthesis protein n=1 Tax=Catenuloplanes atrovinosus TaxID=137266 RepID=A0AAE3YR75_9ACTN|nr:phosphodiester glycosidase family protein [Catenuloplanes atrovinosus]MDR7276276.1 exopolysaccharide biosynthesis protein [Catenuloplanes atrovinosus]
MTGRLCRRAVLAGGLGVCAAAAGQHRRLGAGPVRRRPRRGGERVRADRTGRRLRHGTATATGYTSDTAAITIERVDTGTVRYVVADVTVTDDTIMRAAFANDQFGENIIAYPSEIAADVGAVLAINGDYYGFRDTGIVIRNGVAFRDRGARQGLAIYADGTARLHDEATTDADTLLADGVWHTLSFGPGLVENGVVLDGIDSVEIDTNVGNHSVQGDQPRTGIGLIEANHWLSWWSTAAATRARASR